MYVFFSCETRCEPQEQLLIQWLNWYDFSPLCTLSCLTRLDFAVKLFFFAVTALILFLASVHSLMFFNLWFHTKALFTMVALVWFLASVYYFMYYKIRFLDKVLVTMAALVWLLTSVFFLMLYKIRSPSKNISQWMHWNGFSPVCILTWFASSWLCTKLFSQ